MLGKLFTGPDQEALFSRIDAALMTLPPSLRVAAESFRHNLKSAVSAASLPFLFAVSSAQANRLQRLSLASILEEKAKAIKSGERLSRELNLKDATRVARERLRTDLRSEEGIENLVHEACALVEGALQFEEFANSLQEILEQATVFTWGSLEALSRDIFVALLNEFPALVTSLRSDPQTRDLFQIQRIGFDVLEQYGFDLSSQIGNILAERHDMSSLTSIRKVFSALFATAKDLRETLNSFELWELAQRRHLLVHRRGIIDNRYLQLTGDTDRQIGERLCIEENMLDSYVRLAAKAGTLLIEEAGQEAGRRSCQ